ncbi:hypothetical protein ABB37_00105 [Leptomonas pyrrhocoris]|uniref:Major facilitator superfamily (MFS) profile domain-containing protein n=1 Tax=Leptomonas pyrrhocoris TaxID=157538 RepID=A0A0N1J5E1_LEPPY|nr:hypothetical protein ABB37_00105 [Leptomonas pyrrhocoris]KPA85741.1 hypothetical protein ABB37_00105 [Leptomonas pyrrhocoris]|eukprot:XP_015664180.1 hypothetical protein ABB37_00105 [Leptomonas pyrrhocoris]
MQNHKRIARADRFFQESHESPGNAFLATKKAPSHQGDNDVDEAVDDPGHSGAAGAHVNGSGGATYRLLDTSPGVDPKVVGRNLWLFIWLKTIGSFDSGAFSAALGAESGIGNFWGLSMMQQGVLTSSVFLGNVIGCPLAGFLFSRYNEKRILCGALVVHTVFTFLFAAMPDYDTALVNRFFIGLALSFIVVYTPVWVDEFAPKSRQSLWMAAHNAGVPLGIMFGYILAVGPHMVAESIGWNWAFFVKTLLMIPTITYVARVDSRTINTIKAAADNAKDDTAADVAVEGDVRNNSDGDGGEGRRQSVAPSNVNIPVAFFSAAERAALRDRAKRALETPIGDVPAIVMSNLRYFLVGFRGGQAPLLRNLVYVCSVVSLTSLYFVATGLQNFVTQYLQEPPFEASMSTIMIGFGTAVVTAPVCGVIAGGILLDRIGGYKRNLRRVTLFLFAWGSCAVLFSIICIFAKTTRGFLLVMSVVLFCGGALIPPGAGLTMNSLPAHMRSTGAAFSQTVYNLLGNFSGPLVCGWVADVTGKLRYGIITLLLSSALGVLPLFGIMFVAFRDGPLANGVDGAGGDESGVEHVMMEEASEMESIAGADGDEALRAAAVESWDSQPHEATAPPPRPGERNSHSREAKFEFPATIYVGDLVTVKGAPPPRVTGASTVTETPPPASSSPSPPHLSTSPASVPSAGGALLPRTSPLQQPQPATLSNAVRTLDTGRPNLRGPGTAHPVMVPATSAQPLTAQNLAETITSAATAIPRGAPQQEAQQVTDQEILTLESEAAQVMSGPNEATYGMDLVRSWLSTQQQEQQQQELTGAEDAAEAFRQAK